MPEAFKDEDSPTSSPSQTCQLLLLTDFNKISNACVKIYYLYRNSNVSTLGYSKEHGDTAVPLDPQTGSYQKVSPFLLGGLWPESQMPALAVLSSSGKTPGFSVPYLHLPHPPTPARSCVAIFVTLLSWDHYFQIKRRNKWHYILFHLGNSVFSHPLADLLCSPVVLQALSLSSEKQLGDLCFNSVSVFMIQVSYLRASWN